MTPLGREDAFPPDGKALKRPNGLIAAGGDLSPVRLLAAYRRGIFPWYEQGQPVLWWTPDPRLLLDPRRLHVSRSLSRTLRKARFDVTVDVAFGEVIRGCAAPRRHQRGLTWITRDMIRAYETLHALGHAHSIEVWSAGRLAGGLYGVAMGQAFFGESMFTGERDASKVALHWLCARLTPHERSFVDCQVPSGHLIRLGAEAVPRSDFVRKLVAAVDEPGPWSPGA